MTWPSINAVHHHTHFPECSYTRCKRVKSPPVRNFRCVTRQAPPPPRAPRNPHRGPPRFWGRAEKEEKQKKKNHTKEFPERSSAGDCGWWVVASPMDSSPSQSALMQPDEWWAPRRCRWRRAQERPTGKKRRSEEGCSFSDDRSYWVYLFASHHCGAFRDHHSFCAGQCIIIWGSRQMYKCKGRSGDKCCGSSWSVELRCVFLSTAHGKKYKLAETMQVLTLSEGFLKVEWGWKWPSGNINLIWKRSTEWASNCVNNESSSGYPLTKFQQKKM